MPSAYNNKEGKERKVILEYKETCSHEKVIEVMLKKHTVRTVHCTVHCMLFYDDDMSPFLQRLS
jgi:hypothetical protein